MQLSKPTRHQSQSQFGGVGYIQGKLRIKQRISDKPLMHNSLCFFPELVRGEKRKRQREREQAVHVSLQSTAPRFPDFKKFCTGSHRPLLYPLSLICLHWL